MNAGEPDLEHVVDCSAQKTSHAAFDRPLKPDQLVRRKESTELALEAEKRRQRRDGALARLQLRSIMCHPEPLTTRDLQDLLIMLGAVS